MTPLLPKAGRVRRQLAKMIAERLQSDGMQVCIEPEQLIPNQGWWRTSIHADCMPWTGQMKVKFPRSSTEWCLAHVESWATMSDLLNGFDYRKEGFTFELLAHKEKNIH